MGGTPYCYFTPYQQDIAAALAALREHEFRAGRYDPALLAATPPTYTFQQRFPPTDAFPSPGPQHASIEEAFAAGMESGSGTGSIIDMMGLSTSPALLCASPTTHETLMAVFRNDRPSHDDVVRVLTPMAETFSEDQLQGTLQFWEQIGRGEGRYFIVYSGHEASEIFFAGISLD